MLTVGITKEINFSSSANKATETLLCLRHTGCSKTSLHHMQNIVLRKLWFESLGSPEEDRSV